VDEQVTVLSLEQGLGTYSLFSLFVALNDPGQLKAN
jgi:hypothetical protein